MKRAHTINMENLMIEESALMKKTSSEAAFQVVHSIIKKQEKISNGEGTTYEYYIIEEKPPNYFRYRHEKPTGWASTLLPIRAWVEIHFQQIENDVKLTIKMYKRRKTASMLNNVVLTPDIARLIWIDHVLEVFEAVEVSNYDKLRDNLLNDDLLEKRKEFIKESKRRTLKYLGIVIIFLIIFSLLSWIHNIRLASIN